MEYLELLYVFFKIGLLGFGGGYAMISMIIDESSKFSVTLQQFADLNALDMVVPGPIAINAATFVGYLDGGLAGAIAATIGVAIPSFLIITLVMRFMERYRKNKVMNGFLSGVKPAAVGLIASAAITVASGVLLLPEASWSTVLTDPLATISIVAAAIFIITAAANIRFKVNPILLTLIAGVIGAIWL